MSSKTENLELFKYDTEKDTKSTFSIEKALNENWDKIDNFAKHVKFVPFCFNAGLVDAEGKAACVTYSNNTLTLLAGSVCTSAGGTTYAVSEDVSIDISSLSAGEHSFAYDAENQTLEEFSKVVISSTQPEDLAAGVIWLDNSVMPYSAKIKNSNGEIVAREIIPIPVTLDETANLINKLYNQNGLEKDIKAGNSLLQAQISNCILEIPENINYEINSAGRIILKAGSKVYVSTNGTFEAVTLNTNTPEGANELWTQDHSRRLFVVYIPETNRVQAHALDYTYAQTTAPTTFLTGYALWYNTDTKVIKATVDSGATWRICSLPIMIGRPGGTNIGWRGYVDNVFNGMGFISQYSFVLPNVRVLFADRRNANGTLKNKEIVSDVVHFQSLVNQTSQLGRLMFRNNALMLGGYGVTNYFEQETVPSGFGQHAVWYNTRENQVYVTGDSGTTWTKTYEIVLPKLTKGSVTSAITDISMPYPLKIGDVNINMPALKSANGYTRLPNGIIVQWGTLPSSGDPATVTISFPIPFSNNQYGFVATPRMTTNYNDWSFGWVTKNTTNCTMFCKTQGQAISWIVVGY